MSMSIVNDAAAYFERFLAWHATRLQYIFYDFNIIYIITTNWYTQRNPQIIVWILLLKWSSESFTAYFKTAYIQVHGEFITRYTVTQSLMSTSSPLTLQISASNQMYCFSIDNPHVDVRSNRQERAVSTNTWSIAGFCQCDILIEDGAVWNMWIYL